MLIAERQRSAERREALKRERDQIAKRCEAIRHRLDHGQNEAPGSELAPLEEQLSALQAEWTTKCEEVKAEQGRWGRLTSALAALDGDTGRREYIPDRGFVGAAELEGIEQMTDEELERALLGEDEPAEQGADA